MDSTTAIQTRSSTNDLLEGSGSVAARGVGCFHCGASLPDSAPTLGEKPFCCLGCKTVYELFVENGLSQFYDLAPRSGTPMLGRERVAEHDYLDLPEVRARLVDYSDETLTRVTFSIPSIHCIACVWLLEHLFQLNPAFGKSQVNFPRREVAIAFDPRRIQLSGVVSLLTSIGYEPEFKLANLDRPTVDRSFRRLYLQIGIAGFAFGNIMLFSLSNYFGLDSDSGPRFRSLVGILSLALSIPVITFSASDYWRTAWVSLRRRVPTIDIPIALGLVALFGQSLYEFFSGRSEGYFDSLCGLIFFLLCGRLFQQKTYHRLAFDRDYKSFFPLAVTRQTERGEERASLSQLQVGDRLVIRNGELIPADSKLLIGEALIDYSFVTGEANPAAKVAGDLIFAGGRQLGTPVVVEMLKPVSQSYLTSLWNQEAFSKEKRDTLDTVTNRYSKRFTRVVIGIALAAALFWSFSDGRRAVKAFTSVLIVACPCALALAAPVTLGTAQRWMGRRGCYLKNATLIESLAEIDTVVFDKTGTLTESRRGSAQFHGAALDPSELAAIGELAGASTHPHSRRILRMVGATSTQSVNRFEEIPGCGVRAEINGRLWLLGSLAWIRSLGVVVPDTSIPSEAVVHLAAGGTYRGCFSIENPLRPNTRQLLRGLADRYEVHLLSGDQPRERERFREIFGTDARLNFNQSPHHKLNFIRDLQSQGRKVMMVGDGLNDAGALRQSLVGVAVVEDVAAFSPASDAILEGASVEQLLPLLRYAKDSIRVVRISFWVSSAYNAVGVGIAASGLLSPIVCAILMPLSSFTVVAVASGLVSWLAPRDEEISASATSSPWAWFRSRRPLEGTV